MFWSQHYAKLILAESNELMAHSFLPLVGDFFSFFFGIFLSMFKQPRNVFSYLGRSRYV